MSVVHATRMRHTTGRVISALIIASVTAVTVITILTVSRVTVWVIAITIWGVVITIGAIAVIIISVWIAPAPPSRKDEAADEHIIRESVMTKTDATKATAVETATAETHPTQATAAESAPAKTSP